MTKFVRLAALAAAATFVASPAFAAPVASDPVAKAHAKIVKPLTLEMDENLDFGTIVVGTLAGPDTVTVDQTTGNSDCGTSGNLTCQGTTSAARYKVTGTNNMWLRVDTTGSNLTNLTSGGGEQLAFSPTADFDLQLSSSGQSGDYFNIGGSITIDAATVPGDYEGDIVITVDYL